MSNNEFLDYDALLNEEKKKKNRKIIIAVVAAILVVIIALLGFKLFGTEETDGELLESAVKAELGQLENKSNDEIEAELNRVVEQGSMAVCINMNPVFVEGREEGSLQIENSQANHYAQEVVITIDETGEEIYRSGIILPGYHIQTDVLNRDLDAGNYDCTAIFYGYDVDAESFENAIPVGSAAVKVRVSILT